ncbi:MAG: chemotaxis response regulator protein-glutamate methylesterase [Gammaproteobacteria bacterium]
MTHKIKVLIIDDSALIRQMLTEILNAEPSIEVVGTAADPIIARDKIKQLHPDVLTLDVEMPRMDGITFLSNLMRLHPMPVLMVSSLTGQGADVTLDALELGAVDYVTKPKVDLAATFNDYAEELIEKVKMAAAANIRPGQQRPHGPRKIDPKLSADAVLKKSTRKTPFKTTDTIIAIGASTGGTEAIREVLEQMPADAPGTVISQHIPEGFSASFAERMNNLSEMNVYEARDGQQIVPGDVCIAPGNRHLLVERSGARYICRLNDGQPVNRHKPSVDVMFRSVAQNVGKNAIGVILTGMGADGAMGLAEMHDAGAPTIAQDENTSVVWGMPGEAVRMGGTDAVLPLLDIPVKLQEIYLRSSGEPLKKRANVPI